MSRPLFKNKKNKKNKKSNDFDDIYDSIYAEEEDDSLNPKYDSLFDSIKTPTIEYKEEDDNDLSILDNIINRGKSSKERDRENKKRRKKEEKQKKKKEKKERRQYEEQEESMIDLEELYDDMDIRKRKAEKDSENFYEDRFGGSMVLLRELMKQVNGQLVNNISIQDQLKVNRMRGSLNALTTQSANINSLLGTKLSVIKEINSINKVVSDLELKKQKDLAAVAGKAGDMSQNEDYMINEIFGKIVNDDVNIDNIKYTDDDGKSKSTKKKKKKTKKRKEDYSEDDFDSLYDNMMKSDDNRPDEDDDDELSEEDLLDKELAEEIGDDYEPTTEIDPDEYDDIDDALEARINELMDEGELEFSDTEAAYKYEGNCEIVVVKNINTERWRFVALDSEGDEIFDYPLPTKRAVGRVEFDREHGIMKDKLGNVYRVQYERND